MISSTSPPVERGLDTMVLVYSLLQGHPAAAACEQLLRIHSGWFTGASVIFEAKSILTKVYGEDPTKVTQKLHQVVNGPVVLLDLKPADVLTVLGLADGYALDFADAVLLHLARENSAPYLVTDDHHLAKVCSSLNIAPVSPLDTALRHAVATWEAAHLPPKGLPRVLRRVHQWLSQAHTQAAQDFWSQTGAACHLP